MKKSNEDGVYTALKYMLTFRIILSNKSESKFQPQKRFADP